KCNSHEKAFCSFVKEEWILVHKFCLYINCAVNLSNGFLITYLSNKWLPTSEYNCRFVCAVMFIIIKL
ncbi:hypothetical protein T10_5584, partial [Trichinella papuae]